MDLSKLTDQELDDLEKQSQEQPAPETSSLSSMSDEELDRLESSMSESEQPGMFDKAHGQTKNRLLAISQGVTSGFGDELAGFVGSKIVDPVASKLVEGYKPDTYEQARDFARLKNVEAKQENPRMYTLGEVGGALNTGMLLPGSVSTSIPGAIGLGATYGLGSSNAATKDELIGDAITGGAIGGLTGGASKLAPKLGQALLRGAARTGGKFLGLKNPFDAEELGRIALDKGLIKPWRGTEGTLNAVEELKNVAGKRMGQSYGEVDKMGKFISPKEVSTGFKEQFLTPAKQEIGATIDPKITWLMERPTSDVVSAQGYQNLKQEMGKLGKFDPTVPNSMREQAQQAYGFMSDKLDDIVGSKLGGEELQAFQQAKKDFGFGAQLTDDFGKGALDKKLGREFNRAPLSGVDVAVGSVSGAPGFAIKKSLGALKAENVRSWTGDQVGKILTTSPQVFGKYAPVLQQAQQRGPNALNAAIFTLNTKPEFREIQRQINGQEQPNQ